MFCPNCGSSNPDNATHCANCGISLNAQPMPAQNLESHQDAPANFKDHRTTNIILTVLHFLCCSTGWFVTGLLALPLNFIALVLSIVGVVFSSQAKSAFAAGNYTVALSKAKVAKIMAIIPIAIDVIVLLISIVMMILVIAGIGTGAMAALMEEMDLICIALR